MDFKVFLDANVLLDLTLRRGNFEDAKSLIELIEDGTIKGVITPAIVHILGFYLTKAYDAETAKEIILNLLTDIEIIDIPHDIVLLALNSQIRDIEDSLQYYSAIYHKANYFVSMDKQLRRYSLPNLPVLMPRELLDIFNR
jgi:predicted nucleic acid-binding protein